MSDFTGVGTGAQPQQPQTPDVGTTDPTLGAATGYDPLNDPVVQQAPGPSAGLTDLSGLDAKLQYVQQVEAGWSLPALPDQTRLDLATIPNSTHEDLGSLLWGLAQDLNPLSAAPAGAATQNPTLALQGLSADQFQSLLTNEGSVQNPGFTSPQDPNAGINQIRSLVGGLEGQKSPSVVDPNASQALIKRAMGYGILGPNTPLSYQPGDASVFSEVAYRDLQSRLHGNEPGAVSVNSMANMLSDFLSPQKLGSAAWNAAFHSFVPSAHDTSSAVSDWSRWLKNPLSGHDLLHAFAHTIPVVTPIATDVLLITGLGEVIGAARAGMTAADTGIELADAAEASYQSARSAAQAATSAAREGLTQAKDAGTFGENLAGRMGMGDVGLAQGQYDLARAAEPGFVSNQLARFGATSKVADAMNAWRAWKPAQLARLSAGVGMRLGTAELAGAHLGPSDSTLSQSVAHFKLGILNNRYVSDGVNVLSIPLAPPSIFRPGTFTSVFEPAKNLLQTVTMASKDFDQAHTTYDVIRGLSAKSQRFRDLLAQHSDPTEALAEYLGGDREAAGTFVAYAAHMTAIDSDAWAAAARTHPDPLDVVPRKAVWLQRRGQITSQLIHLDENDVDSFLDTMGRKAARSAQGMSKGEVSQLGQGLRSDVPEDRQSALDYMNDIVKDHNAKRAGVATQMLNQLKPGQVEAWTRDFFGNEDNWHNYVSAYDDMRHNMLGAGDGVLSVAPQVLESGRMVRSSLRREPAFGVAGGGPLKLGDQPFSNVASNILDRNVDTDLIQKSWTMPASKDLVPATNRFALARLDTPTVQDQAKLLSNFRLLQRMQRAVDYISAKPDVQEGLANLFSGLNAENGQLVPQNTLAAALRDAMPGAGDRVRRAASTVNALNADSSIPFRALSSEGGQFADLGKARASLQSSVDSLEAQTPWSEQWGIPTNQPLDSKLKTLKRMMNFTAADVTNVPDELKERLARYGYKPVAGAQFVHPQDLKDLAEPFPSLTKMQMRRLSLGTFFQPQENQALNQLLKASLHTRLTDVLADHGLLDKTALLGEAPQAGDVNDLIDRLYGRVYAKQMGAESALQNAKAEGGFADRVKAQLDTTLAPQGLRDLSFAEVRKALPAEYSENPKLVNDVYQAVLKSHDVGFRYNGLATIEDKLRSYNVLTDGLHLFGKTSTSAMLKRIAVGGALGAGFGAAGRVAQGDLNPNDLLTGASAGAWQVGQYEVAREALGATLRKGLPLLHADPGNFARYAYLPNALAKVRNTFRFTMSPMFDLRRYTKGSLVAQMVSDHEGATLPLLNRIGGLEKDFGPGAMDEARGMYNAASKGEYQNFEDTEREFSQRGILNYSPKEQMAMTNYRLVKQGVDPQKAFAMTQKIYGYGGGRSAAEKSLNFMFFPFSFEKKLIANSGKFLNDDFARLMMVHDGLATYNMLSKKYDLTKELQDHVPLLNDLEKLNPFEHGVDLGELGGINAPFIRLFTPTLLHAEGMGPHRELQSIATRLLPAFNDIDRLVSDTQAQGHVIFGNSHLTPQAETDAGFNQINALKLRAMTDLKAAGYKDLAQLNNNKALAGYKSWYDNQKAAIMAEYPAYQTALSRAAEKSVLNQESLQVDMRRVGPEFDTLRLFDEYQRRQQSALTTAGYPSTAPEDYPPGTYQQMANAAVWFYKQTAARYGQATADNFKSLYAKYFSKTWGPIERPI